MDNKTFTKVQVVTLNTIKRNLVNYCEKFNQNIDIDIENYVIIREIMKIFNNTRMRTAKVARNVVYKNICESLKKIEDHLLYVSGSSFTDVDKLN